MGISSAIYDVMRAMPVFKPEMRKANRDGLKSQTRRVMMPQPISTTGFWKGLHWANDAHFRKGAVEHCPYGKADDYCYMREPMERTGKYAFYKDDNAPVTSHITGEWLEWRWQKDTLSSIFMPKEAARFVYRYESIRVEQVQDISEEDAVAEGCMPWHENGFVTDTAVSDYAQLWNEINLERGFGWDVNPWVWVVEFKKVAR